MHISPPLADTAASAVIGEHRAEGDVAGRAGQIVASRRWRRSATGNPTLMLNGYWIVVVRHAPTGMYGYAIDRRWGRGRWASEGEAKLAAAMALLALPRKPRPRPARPDRPGQTRWIAARADAEGRDDEDDDDNDDVYVLDDPGPTERSFT